MVNTQILSWWPGNWTGECSPARWAEACVGGRVCLSLIQRTEIGWVYTTSTEIPSVWLIQLELRFSLSFKLEAVWENHNWICCLLPVSQLSFWVLISPYQVKSVTTALLYLLPIFQAPLCRPILGPSRGPWIGSQWPAAMLRSSVS